MTRTATGLHTQVQELEWGSANDRVYCAPVVDGVVLTLSGTPTWEAFRGGETDEATALASGTTTADGNRIYATLNVSDTSVWGRARYFVMFSVVQAVTLRPFKFREYFDVVRVPLANRCPVTLDHLKGFHVEVDAMIVHAAEPQASQAVDMYIHPAWASVLSWVRAQGNRPGLISTPAVLMEVARWTAIINLIRGNRRLTGDLRQSLMQDAQKELEFARSLVRLDYEPTDNGDQTEIRAFNQPTVTWTPDFRSLNPLRGR